MFAAAADWYYSWLEQGKRRNLTCLTIRGWSKHFFGSFVSTAVAAIAVVVDAIVELGVVAVDVDFVGETFVVASVIVVVVSAAAVVAVIAVVVVGGGVGGGCWLLVVGCWLLAAV